MSETTIGIIFLIFTNISALAASIISLIRSSKLLPKELENATLDVKEREISLAEQYENMMQKSVTDKKEILSQLDTLEHSYSSLKNVVADKLLLIEEQEIRISAQDEKIEELSKKIRSQDTRIRNQNTKIRKQAEEITVLTKQLDRMERYNCALIEQMKNANIVPLDISEINGDSYVYNGTYDEEYSEEEQQEE
jgi:chromosome segregation ATPase